MATLAAARIMAGLTQLQLAQLAGVHVNGIKRLERMEDRAEVSNPDNNDGR
jgi:transcriptional regulator with XRE-family HTH domain